NIHRMHAKAFNHTFSTSFIFAYSAICERNLNASCSGRAGIEKDELIVPISTVYNLYFLRMGPCSVLTYCTFVIGAMMCFTLKIPCFIWTYSLFTSYRQYFCSNVGSMKISQIDINISTASKIINVICIQRYQSKYIDETINPSPTKMIMI